MVKADFKMKASTEALTKEDQRRIEELQRDPEALAQVYELEKFRNPNITYKQVLEFPINIFPKEVKEFGEAVAESVKAPLDFFGTAVLGTASTLIGKQYQIFTKTDKSILASKWIVGIGKSGAGKSDMQRNAVKPVLAIQAKFKEEFDQAVKEYKEQMKINSGEELEMPILKQIIASNATIEALKDLLEESAILLFVDELAGWIKAMGQYKKGSSGELEEFLSISDNHIVMVNRKGIRQQINNPFMSVVGGIQPSKLQQILTLGLISDDGFLERFLPCFPNELIAEYNPIGADPGYEERYMAYMSKLLTLNKDGYMKDVLLDSEAKTVFDQYMILNMAEINRDDFDERLESFWRKTFKNLSRLILTMHLLYVASGDVDEKTVPAFTVEAGIQLMDYFKSHFAKMVRFSLGNPQEQKYEALCSYIMGKYNGYVTVKQLAQSKKFGASQECRDLLRELETAGLGRFYDGKANPQDFELFKK